ncbi:Membrane-bound inhibitor of C-type lysozyme [Kaistia soli DSM 19436]|uniref:Membrane-bound inhibitor of C-type lysozyme n=1 Tax=Kaistia soli DSM 19436 TaxID=1122133 RepID=A0A1M4X0R5_9HYPH|nr:MliC family protein [Kaistia soli]SHE86967.1 Membrane-bound inhibitor of C-type lysozyme [Kaistia soli DSM 19436]
MTKTLCRTTSGLLAGALLIAAGPAFADATAHYTCKNGLTFVAAFTTTPGSVALAFADGRKVTLPQAVSADGGRYVKGKTEFWIKGQGGTLTRAGKTTNCQASN